MKLDFLFKFITRFWLELTPFVAALFISIAILMLSKSLPLFLPLFYSLPWGENQLSTRDQLFIIPAIIVLISLINTIISWQLHQSQAFFKKILLGFSLISTLALSITFIKIVLIFI